MKFNFEKSKNLIKKTAIGVGIISTSMGPLEASGQELQQDKTLNKTEVIKNNTNSEITNNPEFHRSEYIKYMEHPSYKQRLAKEMYGDDIIDEEKQKKIDKEYSERMEQIKKVPIQMIPEVESHIFDPSQYNKNNLGNDKVETTPYAASHELSHAIDFRFRSPILTETEKNTWEFVTTKPIEYGFDEIKNKLINTQEQLSVLKKEKNDVLNNEIVKKYEISHEKFIHILIDYINNKDNLNFSIIYGYGPNKETIKDNAIIKKIVLNELNELNSKYFDIQKFWEYFRSSDIQIIEDKNGQLLDDLLEYENKKRKFDNKIEELESLLNYLSSNTEIKARLNSLRIKSKCDLNKEFDINEYPELKNDAQYKDLNESLKLSDDQINELMKYTAMNNKNSKEYYNPDWNYNDINKNQA